MKKVAIGCVLVMVVLVGAASAASYVVYRKVSSTVSGFAELGTIPTLDRSVRKQTAYVPPASGELSERQLQRYLQVQRAVRARLGERAKEFERKYRYYLNRDSDSVTYADVPALISAYRDVAAGYMDAKRAQVDALNAAGFSLDEYRWVRRQAYAALGVPMMDLDVSQIIAEVQSGRTPAPAAAGMNLEPTASPKTRKLVEPHRKTLEANVGLAFFGL